MAGFPGYPVSTQAEQLAAVTLKQARQNNFAAFHRRPRLLLRIPLRAPLPCRIDFRRTALVFALFAAAAATRAQQSPAPPGLPLPAGDPKSTSQAALSPAANGALKVPRLTRDLTLADFPNMAPAEALRDKLARVDHMIQTQPFDGKPATERTEVYLARTESTFFIVFVCFDSHPQQMRAHLARRENIDADDNVFILVDPFQDRRHGILFEVNPIGVQADANWQENSDPDYSYDQIWNSSARRTPQGWIAMLAIPFRSIRSRSTAPEWGFVLSRSLPRNSEEDTFPRISQQISGTLSQEATLTGMESATPRNFQINPYGLLHNLREVDNDDPLNPFFSRRNFAGTVGGDAKAIVKDTVVIDATINPDFSQIESDAPQFHVNQRFALYYPELRPFFLENSAYFDTPITLLYTRTIVNPEFGARVTGKLGRTNIGFLTIDDRSPGELVSPGDLLYGKRAVTTVARVSRDIGANSSIGVAYAQRVLNGNANRVGGIDFNAYLSKHWILNGMSVLSSTHQQDGTYSAGPATRLTLNRNGRNFSLYSNYRDFSQGFEADAGFVTVPAVREGRGNLNLSAYPNKYGIQSAGIQPQLRIAFNRTRGRVFRYNENDLIVTTAHSGLIIPYFGSNSDTLGPSDFTTLTARVNYSENYGGILLKVAPVPQLNARVNYTHGATVNYNPAGAGIPELLHEDQLRAYVTLQPISQLTIDNTYLFDRTDTANPDPLTRVLPILPKQSQPGPFFQPGSLAYESQTLRTKINYQFTRALSARAIVEYDSVLANPLVSTLDRTKQVGTQLLLTWLPHPGTAIYVGYNNDLQNLDRALCNRTAGGQCDPNNTDPPRSSQYLQDGREIFIKVSYLLRF